MTPIMSSTKHSMPTLVVSGLATEFNTRAGTVRAIDDVSFTVNRGEIVALVGESGSGKSMTGQSIMGLVDRPGAVVAGTIALTDSEGGTVDLRTLDEARMRHVRGNKIAMIFQDPMMTLNPVLRIETQMVEAVLAHRQVSRTEARARCLAALERVGIPSATRRLRSYPHELSGGMRQRVAIAIALLNGPELIIADEPTTALDVTIQAQILYEVQKLCSELGTALIWITHDLSVVSGLADKVMVMYAGKIVESGAAREILESPRHPYTAALISSTPSANVRGEPLKQIPGMAPSLANLPSGCVFQERCGYRTDRCGIAPPPVTEDASRTVRCFYPLESRELTS
jgi:peptide/nickel transport system ATP-binding protein